MEINIKNPIDETMLSLNVQPEDYNGAQGLRIIFPEKDSFVMVEKQGQWQVVDEPDINPDLVDAIARQLKTHTRYN